MNIGAHRECGVGAAEPGSDDRRPDTSPAEVTPGGEEDLMDAHRQGPTFWFQQMESPRTGRNRFHIDIYVPHDQVQARIDAALAAGGQIVSDTHAPDWWTLADPEGNEADLAIWG